MTKHRTVYQHFSDPGHGWLKVSIKELYQLGIVYDISDFSYWRGQWVYLEEDKDMQLFIDAKKKEQGIEIKIHKSCSKHKYSRINNYRSFGERVEMSEYKTLPVLFNSGSIVITDSLLSRMQQITSAEFLKNDIWALTLVEYHKRGVQWNFLLRNFIDNNFSALKSGHGRIISIFRWGNDVSISIVTDLDKKETELAKEDLPYLISIAA